MTKAQSRRILAWLSGGRTLSALEALERFGCLRLAARIHDLRRQGYRIKAERVSGAGKHWVRYRLGPA